MTQELQNAGYLLLSFLAVTPAFFGVIAASVGANRPFVSRFLTGVLGLMVGAAVVAYGYAGLKSYYQMPVLSVVEWSPKP